MLADALIALALASPQAPAASPVEVPIEAPGPSGNLRGTLLQPAEAEAHVLIVPGSGPTDRDGNSPLGVAAAPYRKLAAALATRGIASVRIDKRGMFGSAGAVADANAVTIADYAEDIRNWVKAVRSRTGAGCVWLLGHSEGGLVASAAAQQPDGICGLILVAAPGRKLGTLLREQLRANPANAPLLDQAMAAIDSLEAGKRVEAAAIHPALQPLFAPQVQGFVISLFSYDPAELIGRVRKPVLIVQGQRDLQVAEADARRLAAAASRSKLVLLPGVNHVLKAVASDDRAANVATYADPDLPIAPALVDAIADFIRAAGSGHRDPP
jgi:pimeloyl-ACP methyl ester carboxylesterase